MNTKKDRAIVVSALKHAAPYIRLFKGKVFVIKAGGEVFADADKARALVEQVGILHQVGIRVVLVHGGGPQSTKLAEALGLDTTFIDGRRVTTGGCRPAFHHPWCPRTTRSRRPGWPSVASCSTTTGSSSWSEHRAQ